MVRTFKFQSCWDGKNTDSANHRTHVAFADKGVLSGRIQGDSPTGAAHRLRRARQGRAFAVDSFPEQLHKPVTDHGDFIDVFSDQLMGKAVNCINTGALLRLTSRVLREGASAAARPTRSVSGMHGPGLDTATEAGRAVP